jgi:GalNAc5-diNAcBac-PP-undecaprenol beta-1,3-glucosyltransferase
MKYASPFATVIIPTYKRPELLLRAIDSIQSTQQEQLEIIVIDDDPEMSAAEITKKFPAAQYVAKRGVNQGLSASRNIGISLSRGRFIMFLDDDDYLAPCGLDRLFSRIDTKSSFYFGEFAISRNDGLFQMIRNQPNGETMLVCNTIPVGSYLIEKSAIRYKFDEQLRSHEDWDFLLKNVDWNKAKYIDDFLVIISKDETSAPSMQKRLRDFFPLDYLTIYSRFPAPHLSDTRSTALKALGLDVPESLLKRKDKI